MEEKKSPPRSPEYNRTGKGVTKKPPLELAFRLRDDKNIVRAGTIPITMENGNLFLLLFQDAETGELGDFGGGRKVGEDPIQTAYRELTEESRGIFSCEQPLENFYYFPSLSYEGNAILFMFVSPEWREKAVTLFNEAPVTSRFQKEGKGVVWVTQRNFLKLITKEKNFMWRKIREIFSSQDCDLVAEGLRTVCHNFLET